MKLLLILILSLGFAKEKEKKSFLELTDTISLTWNTKFPFKPKYSNDFGMTSITNNVNDIPIAITIKKNKSKADLKKIKHLWKEFTQKQAKRIFRVNIGCKKIGKKAYQCLRKGGNKKTGYLYEVAIWVDEESFTEIRFQSDKSMKKAENIYKQFSIKVSG